MKTIASALLIIIVMTGCNKTDLPKNTPDCIADKIPDDNTLQTCDNSGSVSEYTFQDELVYVFDPGTCGADLQSVVYDDQCAELGVLGGIAGSDTINGESFSQNAVFERSIWEK